MPEINAMEAATTKWPEIKEGELQSPACIAVYKSFGSNVVRASNLLTIPAYAGLVCSRLFLAKEKAEREIIGDDRRQETINANQSKLIPRVDELFGLSMIEAPDQQLKSLIMMICQCDYMFSRSGPGYEFLLENLLKSILVQMWGAIEVMIGDLWEHALNEHPNHLSALLGEATTKKDDPKKLDLNLIEKHNFNVSSVMGTLLKDRFNFTVLADAKRAYTQSFRDNGDAVKAALDADPLRALSSIRHVLVHRGGVLDNKCKNEVSGIAGLDFIHSLQVGDSIFIDGPNFKRVMQSALDSAIDLIKSVDAWLAAHPTK
jgi:hypothetical protein